MLDSITVARCAYRRRVSAKRLLPGRDPALKSSWRSTDEVFEVDLETHPLVGLGSIFALLRQLQPDRHAFVMRGAVSEAALARGCRRVRRISQARLNKRTGVTNPAYVEGRARHWACIDVDDLEAPEGMDPTGPEALAYVVAHLPPEFCGVS